jgi:hypothetical protein
LAPWGGFVDFDHAKFREELQRVVAAAKEHVAAIEKRGGRGKGWDYHLKRLHVYMTACFCEYFDHSFEPSRLNSTVTLSRKLSSYLLSRFSNLPAEVPALPLRFANT